MLRDVRLETKPGKRHVLFINSNRKDMAMTTTLHNRFRRPILDLFATPFRPRSRVLDHRALSDHFKRDIGMLDGHASAGSIR
jgi:hypothetical protein